MCGLNGRSKCEWILLGMQNILIQFRLVSITCNSISTVCLPSHASLSIIYFPVMSSSFYIDMVKVNLFLFAQTAFLLITSLLQGSKA